MSQILWIHMHVLVVYAFVSIHMNAAAEDIGATNLDMGAK